MKKIYVAGPMRGLELFNFPAFDDAAKHLRAQGLEVISPADLDRDDGFDPTELDAGYDWQGYEGLEEIGFSLHDAIDRDIEALKTCDSIYMIDGWEKSKGAQAEKAIAEWLGLTVTYQMEQAEPDILEEALRITKGDRQAQYGPPDQDFARTAAMWSAWKGVEFEPRDVAIFMILLKTSREKHQKKRDNWVDIAGYSRCGSLCGEGAHQVSP